MKKPRNIQVIVRIACYKAEHCINRFGDYDRVAIVSTRNAPLGDIDLPRTKREYFLLPKPSFRQTPLRITRREFLIACESLFCQAATQQDYEGPRNEFLMAKMIA